MSTVLKLSYSTWRFLFLWLQIINLAFFISVMNADEWFRQKWEYTNDQTFVYRGSLLKNLKTFTYCESQDSFILCYDSCRDSCENYSNESDCKETCERFKYWYRGGTVFIAFETLAVMITVNIAAFIVLSFFKIQGIKKVSSLFVISLMMIAVFVCHFLAFVIYAGVVDLKYDKCSHDFDYEDKESVCAEGGPEFSLFILIWLLVCVPVICFVGIKSRKEGEGQVEPAEVKDVHKTTVQ
jgi:hypothetical protein